MITAGIDMGAKNIKVVVLRDGEVLASALVPGGFDAGASAGEALAEALKWRRAAATRWHAWWRRAPAARKRPTRTAR
jgi:activator of 2-hydroxyglutaryl-CoA dehydratase